MSKSSPTPFKLMPWHTVEKAINVEKQWLEANIPISKYSTKDTLLNDDIHASDKYAEKMHRKYHPLKE